MLAAVFRSKNAAALASQIAQSSGTAFKALHNCHHDLRIAGADGQAYASRLSGQTAAYFFPGRTAVRAFENSADIFAASRVRSRRETPGRALPRVKRCVNVLRITRIENDIAAPSARVMRRSCLQNEFPCFAAIGCFVEPALAAVCPQMSHRRDVSDVWIFWIDHDARNRAAIFQPDVYPMFAAVGCSVHAIA